MTSAVTSNAEPDLIVRREGGAGIIRLNRPKAINALTLEMTRDVARALADFEKDPRVGLVLLEGAGERGLCAGGDIRSLYDSSVAGGDLGKVFWREEYDLNAWIARYPKPYVAFMDGLVMGGGVGLSAHGSHRVVTDRTKVAMPEVGLGFFPDVVDPQPAIFIQYRCHFHQVDGILVPHYSHQRIHLTGMQSVFPYYGIDVSPAGLIIVKYCIELRLDGMIQGPGVVLHTISFDAGRVLTEHGQGKNGH